MPARRTGSRIGTVERRTNETTVAVRLDVDGRGRAEVNTGLGLIDHFLDALATHARFDLNLAVRGDLEVDDHHTIEDAAIVLGQALDAALGDRRGIVRFADASVPLDESLARAVVDCSGRPGAWVDLGLVRPAIGPVATENIEHFLVSFATSARCTVHIDVLRGRNDHHRAEAAFKAFAVALRRAVAIDPIPRMPSTKGSLT
ncbi:MAG: imidazoleglycerol-phosphate dehydratase HisB [Phycisphaerales bacterium]